MECIQEFGPIQTGWLNGQHRSTRKGQKPNGWCNGKTRREIKHKNKHTHTQYTKGVVFRITRASRRENVRQERVCLESTRTYVHTSGCPDEAHYYQGHAHEDIRHLEQAQDQTEHRRNQQREHAVAQNAHALEERAGRGGRGRGREEGGQLFTCSSRSDQKKSGIPVYIPKRHLAKSAQSRDLCQHGLQYFQNLTAVTASCPTTEREVKPANTHHGSNQRNCSHCSTILQQISHCPPQELCVECYESSAAPHHHEHRGEHQRPLVRRGRKAQNDRQRQAHHQRPPQVP